MSRTGKITAHALLVIFGLFCFASQALALQTNVYAGSANQISNTNFDFATTLNFSLISPTDTISDFKIYLGNFPDTSSLAGEGSGSFTWSTFSNYNLENFQIGNGNYWVDFEDPSTAVSVVVTSLVRANGIWSSSQSSDVSTVGLPDASPYISAVETTGLPGGDAYFFNQFATSTLATSTLVSATNLLSFLNVPQLLSTRMPFAYIFQIYAALTGDLSTTSSGQLFPTTTLVLPWTTSFSLSTGAPTASTSLSVNYFSTTTLTEIIGPTLLAVIRGLLGAIVYVELGFWLWRDARSKKHIF